MGATHSDQASSGQVPERLQGWVNILVLHGAGKGEAGAWSLVQL